MKELKEETKTQNEKKPETKGKRVIKAIVNTIITIMIVLVLIVSIVIAALALTSKSSGISTIFGYTIQPIQSDSMKGPSPDGYEGGDFGKGDLMIAKATNFDASAEYNKGDIVTFVSQDTDGNKMLIVHRIIDVSADQNGTKTYQTQGDNRETSPAPDQMDERDYLHAIDIGSIYYTSNYQGKILKGWGSFLDYIQSQQGFFFVILLPMIIFFMYAVIRVVINTLNYKKSKADEEKEEAVKAAVAAALASQSEEKESDKDAADKESSDAASADAETAEAGSDEKAEDQSAEESVKMTAEQLEQFKQFQEFQKMQKAQQEQNNSEKDPEAADK